MASEKRHEKPTGTVLSVKMSGDGSQELIPSIFPETKEEVEEKAFSEFLAAAERSRLLPFDVESWERNETDDLDLTIQTSMGHRTVELMEYAPLEGVKGGHATAPSTFTLGDRVRMVFRKIREKSVKYGEVGREGRLLVIYTTDWKFFPVGPEGDLLAYLLHSEKINFSQVFISCSVGGGAIPSQVFPTSPERWTDFNPDALSGLRVHVLDPTKWELGVEEDNSPREPETSSYVTLREWVGQRLPASVQSLVVELETFARTPILVARNPNPPSKDDPNPTATALMASESGTAILVRSMKEVPVDGLLHQLLLLRRYWIEGVPQVVPAPGPEQQRRFALTSKIEAALEYLFVVPEQARLSASDPLPYWNRTYQWIWDSHPWPLVTHPWNRRMEHLLHWLGTARLVTDDRVKVAAQRALELEGLYDQAVDFAEKMAGAIPDKARMVSTTCRFLEIPREDVRLMYLNAPERERRYEAVVAS